MSSPDVSADTTNLFGVAVEQTEGPSYIVLLRSVDRRKLTHDEALNLAAWLLGLVDKPEAEKQKVIDAIRNT